MRTACCNSAIGAPCMLPLVSSTRETGQRAWGLPANSSMPSSIRMFGGWFIGFLVGLVSGKSLVILAQGRHPLAEGGSRVEVRTVALDDRPLDEAGNPRRQRTVACVDGVARAGGGHAPGTDEKAAF